MGNRREFIQGSLAALVGVAATPAITAFPAFAPPPMEFHKIVFDTRFPAAKAFGAEAKRSGADVHALNGDITSLWYHDLYHRWRESAAPIAGMTRYSSLFTLDMMARDAGLRVIYRAHHRQEPKGVVSHEVFGPLAALRSQAELVASEWDWSRKAAKIVLAWPREMTSISRPESNIADADHRFVGPETLISWIIASARKA